MRWTCTSTCAGAAALVTGGATGIGRAISEVFIDNGAAVAIGYRSSAAAATVNSVAPGVILTAIHERTNTPETLEKLRLTTAAGRLGQPADCAGAVLFLTSEAASYVTGSTLAVNGGMRMD